MWVVVVGSGGRRGRGVWRGRGVARTLRQQTCTMPLCCLTHMPMSEGGALQRTACQRTPAACGALRPCSSSATPETSHCDRRFSSAPSHLRPFASLGGLWHLSPLRQQCSEHACCCCWCCRRAVVEAEAARAAPQPLQPAPLLLPALAHAEAHAW